MLRSQVRSKVDGVIKIAGLRPRAEGTMIQNGTEDHVAHVLAMKYLEEHPEAQEHIDTFVRMETLRWARMSVKGFRLNRRRYWIAIPEKRKQWLKWVLS